MKKSTWLLAVLAAVVVLGAWRIRDLGRRADASELLTEAELLAEGDSADGGLALRKLDRALTLVEDEDLRRTILDRRSRLRAARGAFELAREDLEQLLDVDPDNVSLRIRRAELTARAEEHAAARQIYSGILEDRPNHGWTRTLLADVRRDQAEERLDQLAEELEQHLDSASLARLQPTIDQIVCLPPGDALRAGLEAKLLQDVPPEAHLTVAVGISEAGSILEEVRAHFATSMASSVNPRSLFGMIDLLHRAGRLEETIDFGLAVADVDAAISHAGTLQHLALALEEQGRPLGAAAVVNQAVAKDPTWHVDFLSGWCGILYRAGSWQRLENAAIQLSRSAGTVAENRAERNAAFFYQGMAGYNLARPDAARQSLTAFVAARPQDPVEGATGIAWMTLAAIELEAGNPDAALKAYTGCTKAAPLHAAEAWLALADRRAKNTGQALAEAEAVAMAIGAEPALAEELDERLRDATARGMTETGRDLGLIRSQLRENGRWYPDGNTGLVMLLALARTHLEANDPDGAAIAARRLLRDHPGYAPALDTLALAHQVRGRHQERFDVLLQLVEAAGPTPTVLAALEQTRDELTELPTELLVRWMRADPDFTGSMELARGLAEQGRPQAALGGMVGLSRELFDDRDRLLYGELLLEIEQHEGILTAVGPIAADGPYGARSALLQLLAGTALGRVQVLEASLDQLQTCLDTQAAAPAPELLQRSLDVLLEAGLGPAVLRYTTLLAEHPLTRDGRRLGQAAMAELLYGDPLAAEAWLDRAEAFLEDGSPLVGRLALAVAADDAETRIDLARELRDLAPAWARPHHAALLAGLEGRRGEADGLAAEALAEPFPDPRAHLVAAALNSLSGRPTPAPDGLAPDLGPEAGVALATLSGLPAPAGRQVLLLMLALDCPDWQAWGLAKLSQRTNRLVLGPFATMLAIDHAVAHDDLDGAATLLEQGRQRWTGFLPFWDQAEDLALARHGRPDHPELATLRRQRRMAGVAPRDGVEPTPAEQVMDLGLEAIAAGRTDEGLARARAAVDLAPDELTTQYLLARTTQVPAPAESAAAWHAILTMDPAPTGELAAEARTGLVAALDEVGPDAVDGAQLAALVGRYPDSPILAVVAAERMAADLDGSSAGLPALLQLMDDFLEGHRDLVLDELEQGAARRWFDFLERYDPARALAFAESQRDLAPRRLEGWTLVALGLEANGRRLEALEAWRRLARMTTTPEVTVEAAAWVAELGGSHEEVTALLNGARRMPKAADLAAAIEYVRGRSLANIGRDYLPAAAEAFEALHAAPSTPGVDRDTLAARLGITYLHRGLDGDGKRAQPLLEQAAAATDDALRRDLLTALANLAPQLDRLRKERTLSEAEARADG